MNSPAASPIPPRNGRPPPATGIQELLNPRSVAVIGASRRQQSIGGAIVANLKRDGFTGAIYPVNPNASDIQGLRAYPTVAAIGAPVDLAVIAVPAPLVESAVDDCITAGTKGLLIITSGFAEASEQGREAQQRIVDKVRAAGIRLVGPNCMGMINTDPAVRLNATFTPVSPPPGNIGILSQSGALGLTILDHVKQLNLGVSSFISVGNKADVSGNDLLEHWADDPRTDVIVLYLESFGNPRKFARLAPKVVSRKPIIAVKAGRSAAGTRAASSHSAALASLDVAVDALFDQAGVIRTDTLESLFDVAALLSTQPAPHGPRVGVVTNAGGPGILLADACEARGLELPELSTTTTDKLRAFLPPHAGLANPVDLVGSDAPDVFQRTIEIVGGDDAIDALVVMFIPPLMTTRPEDVAAAIAHGAGTVPPHKPLLGVFFSSRGTPELLSSGPRGRIPTFAYPENAAFALATAYRSHLRRKRPQGRSWSMEETAAAKVRAIIDRATASADSSFWLDPEDTAAVLEAAGVRLAPATTCRIEDAVAEARNLGYPLVMKVIAPEFVHKSDVGGVVLGIESEDDVQRAVLTLRERMDAAGATLSRVLLQRQITGGVEAIVGITSDPVFGPLIVVGMGGLQVELLRDASFRLTPVTDVDAEEMIDGLRLAPLLDGYRGAPPADRAALVDLILRVSALVEIVPELQELDINPVLVQPRGKGAVAVDARIRVAGPRS